MATGIKTSVYVSYEDHARWSALAGVGAAEVFRRGLDAIEAERAAEDGTGPAVNPLDPVMGALRAALAEALNDEGLMVWPERMKPPPRKSVRARAVPRAPQGFTMTAKSAG